nr:Hypothetical protein CBG22447 [Haemonchus contortus]
MGIRCLVRSYCCRVDRTLQNKSLHSVSHDLFPSVTQYELFSPDFESSPQIEESEPVSDDVLPKVLSKKEAYAHADDVATAKKSGCAPTKRALTLIRGFLHGRSHLKTSLSDRSVTLFNFHSTDFAEKLVQSNIGSLVLVESEHSYARQAKSFARVQRSHSRNVAAYRAELPALLGISRKKVVTFPSHLLSARPKVVLNPFTLTQKANHEEPVGQYSASPILVSALPLVSQQTNVLAALMNNLLLHHAGIDLETLYAYGEVELVTFLSAVTLSHLLASADQRLSFMSHAHRRYSALFFKLFNVELLRVDGFSRHCFAPPISMPKPMPHEKKLKEFNLINGLFYAVGIRPKRYVTLDSVEVGAPNPEGTELDSRCLLTYAYWMNLIGKQQASKRTAKVLEELCPESCSSAFLVVDKDCRIGELSTIALEKAFLVVREELQHLKKFENYKENITSKRSS